MDRQLQYWATYGLLITFIAVAISYCWIDIPLVEWAHAHQLRQYRWLHHLQLLPEIFPVLAAISLVCLAFRSYWATLSRVEQAIFTASLSYVVTSFLTRMLKMLFARTWPATWVDNNPSWLQDNVYGFFWLMDHPAYRSFPSGHTAAIFSVIVVMIVFYPTLRWVGGLLCAMIVIGLVGNYYHFLSDMIAGAYLGTLVGLTASYWPEKAKIGRKT